MTPTSAGGAVRLRRGRRRVGVATALVLAVAVALVGPASPAQAKKVYPTKSDIAAAQTKAARTRAAVDKLAAAINAADQKMQDLQTTAEQAAEAYNAAESKLKDAQTTAASAQRASASAARDLATARVQLGEFAAASYRSGGDLATVGALLTADGPKTLMDRANTISVLSTQREDVLARVQSAQVVADLLQQQATAALAGVQTATNTVHTAQQQAQAAVDNQAAQVRTLNAQKTTLRNQLKKLDANAVALAERRAAGIRAEQARKAAAAARARAQAGGSPSVPTNAPNGVSIGTAAGAAKAIAFAKSKLGTPYLWGGTGPRYDCSGLTMRAWETGGVQLPRVASWQYAATEKISLNSLRPGDLLFYATDLADYTTIHHVGIYVGNGQMIEAPHTGAVVRYASIWRSDLIGATRP